MKWAKGNVVILSLIIFDMNSDIKIGGFKTCWSFFRRCVKTN
jgi:hypothetical protein